MKELIGKPIVKGIAYNNVLRIEKEVITIVEGSHFDPADELKRFEEVRLKAIEDVEVTHAYTLDTLGEDEAKIFEAHLSMLDDVELIGQIQAYIESNHCHASAAIDVVAKQFIAIFDSMDNPYMRERAADIKDVCQRMIKHAIGFKSQKDTIDDPCIIVAHDLTPSMTAALDRKIVKGVITEVGGPTSHSAIIANLLGIPYVVVTEALDHFEDGQLILFDGKDGLIHFEPDVDLVAEYEKRRDNYEKQRQLYDALKDQEAQTKDGEPMELIANIGNKDDAQFFEAFHVNSVGLFRTEFLFMDDEGLPSEEAQFDIYKYVCDKLSNGYVTIRTLDIGGDKHTPHIDIPKEDNPFLGYRGIRLCLEEVKLFKTQLRAILRASAFGKIKIMFPMIASLEELFESKKILEEVMEALASEGIAYDTDIQVGMMMETPAAVMMADVFAREVDFFSIGTNDLTQYTMAVDRMNPKISNLYATADPAVLRAVHIIATAANEHDIDISICGEAAADPTLIPFWIGVGIMRLSMTPSSLPEVKWHISQLDSADCKKIVDQVLKCRTTKEVIHTLTHI